MRRHEARQHVQGGRASSSPGGRAPRALHPLAWWVWALGVATLASRTTNPLLLGLALAVLCLVVAARRTDAPWALSFRAYLVLGAVVVTVRVAFAVLLGGAYGGTPLLTLPEVPLPAWAAGIRLGGVVEAETVLAAAYDGLRLAVILAAAGAANTLANPRRVLRLLPAALYEAGVAVVVALTLAPQLVDSVLRVRRARRLRGRGAGRAGAVRALAMPVLQDALDRAVSLAAAMDARGYGRSAGLPARTRRLTAVLLLAGLGGLALGSYGLLDASAPPLLGAPVLLAGAVLAVAGLRLGGRRVRRTAYRPDVWAGAEVAVTACAVVAVLLVLLAAAADPAAVRPAMTPLSWPRLPALATLGVLVAALPAVLAPPPPAPVAPAYAAARQPVPA